MGDYILFGTKCRVSSTPKLESLKSKKGYLVRPDGGLPAAIFFARLTETSFRRLMLKCAPVFECRALERVQLQCRSRQKAKREHTRCPLFTFWWTRRRFRKSEYTYAFRLTSRLADLQAWYVHPYSSAGHSSEFNSYVGSTNAKSTPKGAFFNAL